VHAISVPSPLHCVLFACVLPLDALVCVREQLSCRQSQLACLLALSGDCGSTPSTDTQPSMLGKQWRGMMHAEQWKNGQKGKQSKLCLLPLRCLGFGDSNELVRLRTCDDVHVRRLHTRGQRGRV